MGLVIALLGTPTVEVDGEPIDVDTRKAIALCAYLAVEGPQTRDSLAALLWSDSEPERARGALRRTLSVLNKALGGRWLDSKRSPVALEGEGLWCDVSRFHHLVGEAGGHGHAPNATCAACVPPLTEAAALHRGDFLAGFALRDAPAFDDWLSMTASALQREQNMVLDRLVRALLDAGDLVTALEHARRRVTLTPLDEPARRRLMLLHAWRGERSEAIAVYRDGVAALDRELGVAPVEETTSLYEEVVAGRPPPRPAPVIPFARSDAVATRRATTARLVGRDAEMSELRARHAAASPHGRITVVVGETGIGKSRLVEEFARAAEAGGSTVGLVRCHPGETDVAYGAIVEACRTLASVPAARERLRTVGTHHLQAASRLLPELAPAATTVEESDSPGARARFLDGVVRVLSAFLQGPRPGLLVVDDVGAADGGTLEVLRYLARRLDAHPLHLVVCAREGDVRAGQPVAAVLREAPSGSAAMLELGRLDAPAVEELVVAVLGRASVDLAQRLHDESQGLPLFVVEYLATRQRGEEGWELPSSVRELLRARLAELDEVTLQVLTTAAVLGPAFDVETLLRASGRSDEETAGGVESLSALGILREAGDRATGRSRYEFVQERLRTYVYEQASLVRRRLLHGRAAEALLAAGRTPRRRAEVAAEVARHLQAAGRDGEAAEHLRTAGTHARSLFANDEALDHFQTALALGSPHVAELHEAVGDLRVLAGEYEEALRDLEAAIAREEQDPASRARLAHKIGDVHLRRGDLAVARTHLEAALAADADHPAGPGLRARVLADLALVEARAGEFDRADEQARQALEVAERSDDRRALAQVRNILGVLARRRGDLEEARRQLEISAHLSMALVDPTARVAALNNLALAALDAGDVEHALTHTRTALDLCVNMGDRHREAALRNNLADALRVAGRTDEAMEELKEAVRLFAEIGQEEDPQPEIWKLVEW